MGPEGEPTDEALMTQLGHAETNYVLLQRHAIRAFSVLGAPGSGKTTLIERLAERVAPTGIGFAVIAGDPIGDEDHRRLSARGIRSIPLPTAGVPHLDAQGVNRALQSLPLDRIDLLFIENVGTLLGPVDYPLGVERELVVVSVTEGESVVRKHPRLFAQTDLLIINKVDLASAVGVTPQQIAEDYARINPHGTAVLTDVRHSRGIEDVLEALGIDCPATPW